MRGVEHHASQDSDWLAAAAVGVGGLSASIIHGGGSSPSGGKVSGRGPYSGGGAVGSRGQYGGMVGAPYGREGCYVMADRIGSTTTAIGSTGRAALMRRLLLQVDT